MGGQAIDASVAEISRDGCDMPEQRIYGANGRFQSTIGSFRLPIAVKCIL